MGKRTGNADVDLLDLAAGLFFRVRNRAADRFIQRTGIVPSLFEITVILCHTGSGDVTALTAAVFSNERNNLARTEINGCNRCFHRFLMPPVIRIRETDHGQLLQNNVYLKELYLL